jgi:hypothetical protein
MRYLAFPILAFATACSASADDGAGKLSGVSGSRSFDVKGFESVSLSGPDNVIVQVGKAMSVKAVGDTAILDRLEIEVVDGDLRIGRKRRNGVHFNWGKNSGAVVTVTLPVLTGASVAGSGDMDVDHAEAQKFSASVAGSGSLKVGALKADRLNVSIAGSGNANFATGTAADAGMSIAGSGNVDAAGLAARTADISIAGSGDVKAGVSERADVSILGSGDVDIIGDAQCKVSKMGSGDVRCTPATPSTPKQ